MKKTFLLLFALIGIAMSATLASCSSDEPTPQMKNYVAMSTSDATLSEDNVEGITINILLGHAADADQTITLSLQGNDDDVVSLQPSTIQIAKGQKEATFKLVANNKSLLTANRVVTINATFSDANAVLQQPLAITVTPASDMPTLSAEQLALIEGYKERYNIDLMRIIGKHDVQTTVTFNDDDKETYNGGATTRTLTGKTIITLSDYATAEKPVLKITSNPMGMTAFSYEIFRKITVEDEEYFLQTPYGAAAVQASGYDFSNEQFTCELDSIVIDPTNFTLSFTAHRPDAYGDDMVTVPFQYGFTAWDRLKAKADAGEEVEINAGEEVEINDGETNTLYALSDVISMGGSLNPADYLFASTIDTDAWDDAANYVTPAGSIDFSNGRISFSFPWDFTNASGYQRISSVVKF